MVEVPLGEPIAPCIAVVGPANSGKSTLLNRLDAALQHHPSRLLTYVVKGSPDGTALYLDRSPDLRQALKPQVKGRWTAQTPAHIQRWVRNARRHLDLALLDFGGRHDPANDSMLEECSHYIVLARGFEDPKEERLQGMDSWAAVCERCGLIPVARIRSLRDAGNPRVTGQSSVLEAVYRRAMGPRGGDGSLDDTIASGNDAVVCSLVERITALAAPPRSVPYLDLRLARDWTPSDLSDVGGLAVGVRERSRQAGGLFLGGRAPIWAYGVAMHHALDQRPDALILVFDPKVDGARIEVPPEIGSGAAAPSRDLDVRWHEGHGFTFLRLEPTRDDKFVDVEALAAECSFALPAGPPPGGITPLVVSGAAPIWVHLAYSRWLRQNWPRRQVGHWDASFKGAFILAGPGERRFVPCPPPGSSPVAESDSHG